MDRYDEDLYENAFFKNFQSCQKLFEYVTSSRWMILVPRCDTLDNTKFTEDEFQTHTLMSIDDKPTVFRTMNGKELIVKHNTISTGEGFENKKMVTVLFEEMFFNKKDESYRVLCISHPLDDTCGSTDDSNLLSQPSYSPVHFSLEDCSDIIWGKAGNMKIKLGLKRLLDMCEKSLSEQNTDLSMTQLTGMVHTLYTKALNVLAKDPVMKKSLRTSSDASIAVAVETYLMHYIYLPLFRHICTVVSKRDAMLNKITRNVSSGLQLKHLNIQSQFSQNIPRARRELSYINRYTSARGKLHCLRRVVNSLVKDGECAGGSSLALSTDDLLPLLIFLIVKADIPTWWAQFKFMSELCLVPYGFDDEFKFYLATLEAALEHVTNGELNYHISTTEELSGFLVDSLSFSEDTANCDINKFFQLVINNKIADVEEILSRPRTDEIAMKDLARQDTSLMCHPLCSCQKCAQLSTVFNSNTRSTVPDVYSRNDYGFSALHVAAICGHVELSDMLIMRGAVVSATEYRGYTPLHLAAQRGQQAIIVLILHHCPSCISIVDKTGNTALHWAALNGHESCVKALVYINQTTGLLNINEGNDFGDAAIHLASKWGYEGIVDILLDAGALVTVRNRKGQLPCLMAHNGRLWTKLTYVAEFQQELHGSHEKPKMITILPSDTSSLQSSDSVNHRLSTASQADEYIIVESPHAKSDSKIDKLLKFVADGDIQMMKFHLGWLELESEEADVNSIDLRTAKLCHPLCQCSHCCLYQKLTRPSAVSGLHVNSRDVHGFAALHVAALHTHHDIVELLLRRGANPSVATTTHGSSPLHLACQQDNVKVVKMLVEYGSDPGSKDHDGNTALHVCCMCGNASNAFYLIQMGAAVNVINNAGDTPLHCAVRNGFTDIVTMLVRAGADVTVRNNQELTASQCTQIPEMVTCLHTALCEHSLMHAKSSSDGVAPENDIHKHRGRSNSELLAGKRPVSPQHITNDDSYISSWLVTG